MIKSANFINGFRSTFSHELCTYSELQTYTWSLGSSYDRFCVLYIGLVFGMPFKETLTKQPWHGIA